MKKLLCIVLSLAMLLSVSTVAFAAEDKDLAQTLSEMIADQQFINAFSTKPFEEIAAGDDVDTLIRNMYVSIIPCRCGYTYNPQIGDPEHGAPAGTAWNDLPEDWRCPNCGRDPRKNSLNGVKFLGLPMYYMFSNLQGNLDWGLISVSRADMTNLYAGINTYISNYLVPQYTNIDRMCTGKHATAICNFIGHLLVPGYSNKTINFSSSNFTGGTRDYEMEKAFYTKIADESGLTRIIDNNWIKKTTYTDDEDNVIVTYGRKVEYLTLLRGVLNIPFYDSAPWGEMKNFFTHPANEYENASELAAYTIKWVITNAINQGPIQYLLTSLNKFINGYAVYNASIYESVVGLLQEKIDAGYTTRAKLEKFDELFNALAKTSPTDTSHLQFVAFPAYQFSRTNDTTEMFLYLMAYTNLLGKHKNNNARVEAWKAAINRSTEFEYDSKKQDTIYIISAMFQGNMRQLVERMDEITADNMRNIPGIWGWNFADFFSRMVSSIMAFFDGIFRSLKQGINIKDLAQNL